ncbi:MAG TPA: glycoside hydrolase family 3 N-terminal domain-containing protein [Jatrophihabitans sp.]|nr:glycoside hydrolase family 3 N-terminal domain-containing protein [Jatrophihabitans sp.]
MRSSLVGRNRRRCRVMVIVAAAVCATAAPVLFNGLPASPLAARASQAPAQLPYQDTSLPFEVRAADLVSRMTLQEKIQQLRAFTQRRPGAPAIPRLGLAPYSYWSEGLHGVARAGEGFPPVLPNRGGEATMFPTGLAMGSTWNPPLVQQIGSSISDEARAMNNFVSEGMPNPNKGLLYFSPTINMGRDPRWGRADESYSEDPYLMTQIAGGYVDGMQGNNPRYVKAGVTAKHFVANNSEMNRHSGSANVTEAELRDYYTPAFEALLGPDHHATSFMTAYSALNGTPVSADRDLLQNVVRRDWGFSGPAVSDCGAISDVYGSHQWTPPGFTRPLTPQETAAWALKSGVDLDCSGGDYGSNLLPAYDSGLVTEADIDLAVTRAITMRMKFGEFDPADQVPWRGADYTLDNQIANAAHLAVSERASEEAPVLLKDAAPSGSDAKLLPLPAAAAHNIVVVGPMAQVEVNGDYSPETLSFVKTPLDGITETIHSIDPSANVKYIPGITGTLDDWQRRKPNIGADIPPAPGQPATPAAVRFLDAAGNELGRITPGQIYDEGDLAGWRSGSPASTALTIDRSGWGGYFGSTTTVPAGTASVQVIQRYADPATQTLPDGHVDLRVGSKAAQVIGTASTDSDATIAYSGPVGRQVKLFFTYRTGFYKTNLTAADRAAIANADAVVAYVGTVTTNSVSSPGTYPPIAGRPADSYEEEDRPNLELPRAQGELVRDIAALNPRTAVYIQAMSQVDVESFKDQVPAIVWTSYNGQYQSDVIGKILFGQVNPSGRLPITWYSNVDQLPPTTDYTLTPTHGRNGRTYQYFTDNVSYPFGYGLSYSKFRYSNLKLDRTNVDVNGSITASVDVSNTSSAPGKDVAQLYVASPRADDPLRPDAQLKAFEKVSLAPGQTKTVTLKVPAANLWFWDSNAHRRTYDRGTWQLWVGPSSDRSSALTASFRLSGTLTPAIKTVAALPDGVVLNAAAPENVIHANVSATRNDDSFYALSRTRVSFRSSDPTVARVDADGTVHPVGAGVAQITATVSADSTSKSTTFPVVVYDGTYTAAGVTLFSRLAQFADRHVSLAEGQAGVQLQASVVPAAQDATYTFATALNEDNTADATVTPAGVLTATKPGIVRVTVVADVGGEKSTRTATITIGAP